MVDSSSGFCFTSDSFINNPKFNRILQMIDLSYIGTPRGLMKYIGEQICEDCLGEGVLYFMEQDKDGHFADTGMKTCHCQMRESEDRIED